MTSANRDGGFFLEGGARGCLLLDGIPASGGMRRLGEALNQSGFTVSAPGFLCASETSRPPRASNWRIWLDEAREAYTRLSALCPSVSLVGRSSGGALAVILAAQYPVSAVALIAPALRLRTGLAGMRLGGAGEEAPGQAPAPRFSTRDALMISRFARRSLFAVVAPILILQPERDDPIHPSSARIALSGVSSREKRVLWLAQSRLDSADEAQWARISDAIKSHLCRASAVKSLVN